MGAPYGNRNAAGWRGGRPKPKRYVPALIKKHLAEIRAAKRRKH
jgi:hypothetical protein